MEVLPKLARQASRQEHNYLTSGKISLPQYWALEHLYLSGKTKMSRIARHLNITKPAVTGLIDRLIVQGLVERVNDIDDRRNVWIKITSKGRKIIENIRAQKHKSISKIFSKLSDKDRREQIEILEKVLKLITSEKEAF